MIQWAVIVAAQVRVVALTLIVLIGFASLSARALRSASQVHHALQMPKLRRGAKRPIDDADTDDNDTRRRTFWTTDDDVQLLEVVWSGARGKDRFIPGRAYETCKKRLGPLQLINKHVHAKIFELHDLACREQIDLVLDVLRDTKYLARVDLAREQLPEHASTTPTELPDLPSPPDAVSPEMCEECDCIETDRNAADALTLHDAWTKAMLAPATESAAAAQACRR